MGAADVENSGAKIGTLYTEASEGGPAGAKGRLEDVTVMKVLRHNEHRRALISVVPTLTLGIIGGYVVLFDLSTFPLQISLTPALLIMERTDSANFVQSSVITSRV
jgi:hypothetical protein